MMAGYSRVEKPWIHILALQELLSMELQQIPLATMSLYQPMCFYVLLPQERDQNVLPRANSCLIFIAITQDAMEITGTFKQCKGRLVKEGFDPTIIKDPLFFLDESKKCYVPMSHEIYKAILDKKLKL